MSRTLRNATTALVAATVLVAGAAGAESSRTSRIDSADRAVVRLATASTPRLKIQERATVQPRLKIQGRATTHPGFSATDKLGAPGLPDLVIEPRWAVGIGLPNTGYCGPWNGGNQKLYFYVKNVGNSVAPASDVQVNFGGPYFAELAVPSLTPNQQVLRSYSIPGGAWSNNAHPNVDFLIAADHNDDMVEADVTNNYGQGICIGPAS